MDARLQGLLAACKEDRFDDGLRLILADYLEDHGDPERGQLIRLQLAQHGLWGDEPEATEWELFQERLLRHHSRRWLGVARLWYTGARLQRGFIRIDATASQVLDHPPTELPDEIRLWLEELYLRHDNRLDEALTSPLLGLFSNLDIPEESRNRNTQSPNERQIRLLVNNPALRSIRSLHLSFQRLQFTSIQALARCEHLVNLRELELHANAPHDPGLRILATAPWLGGLTHLNLGRAPLSAVGLAYLFRSPAMGSLHTLHLTEEIDDAAGEVLANCPKLASLHRLNLEACSISEGALRALAESPYLRPRELDLNSIALTPESARALARGPLLQEARQLFLGSNQCEAETMATLLDSERLAKLEFLQLWNGLDDSCCEILANSGHFARLERLSCSDVGIRASGAKILGEARHLTRLRALMLEECPLGPEGITALVEGGGLPALEGLYLNETRPQVRGLQALVASPLAGQLRRLELGRNDVGDSMAKVLARWPEDSRLQWLDLSSNRITPVGMKALARCRGFGSLLSLNLYQNRIADDGVQALVDSSRLPCLLGVDLRYNGLTEVGGNALLGWSRRDQLAHLWVADPHLAEKLSKRVCLGEDD